MGAPDDRAAEPIETWFAAAGPREAELREVDALVLAALPGIDRQLVGTGTGQLLGYGLVPYRPRSARETTTWPLVALAAQKRHLSLHVSAVVDGRYLPEERAERLGQVSCGRSCIRFTSLDRVDRGELTTLLQDAVAATRSGAGAWSAG